MATPVKRRATSVRLRRDDMRNRPVTQQTSVPFETVPLMQKPRTCSAQADGDDEPFRAGTFRLSSSASVRERRRCLSAEDPTQRPHPQAVTSLAPAAGHDAATRDRCNSS